MHIVFLDLQNTIAPGITKLNQEAIDLIKEIQTKYKFCLCSTACASDLKFFLELNNLDWDYIAEGGALVHTKEFEKEIEFKLPPRILINFKNEIEFLFYENSNVFYVYNYIPGLKSIYPQNPSKTVIIDDFMKIKNPYFKQIFICINQSIRNQFIETMNRKHIRVILIAEDAKRVIFRLVSEIVNKGYYFHELCNYYNTENSIAIGDSIDDLKMFKQVKIKVAVQNAVPLVKAEADYIVEDFSKNGAFKFLLNYSRTL